MNQNYGRVLLTSFYAHKDNPAKDIKQVREYVRTTEEYMEQYKKYNRNQGGLCELVGLEEYQVKPYFDLDPKGNFDYTIIDSICQDIKNICNKDVFISGRDVREEEDSRGNKYFKHSRRIYLKARISYKNIPIIFKSVLDKYKEYIDSSVYNRNRTLFVPLSDRKRNLKVPPLKVLIGSLFDCCATYIEEDYEDLDLKIANEVKIINEPIIEYKQYKVNDDDDYVDTNDKNVDFIKLILTNLKSDRADVYDTWLKVCFAIIGACKKSNIGKTSCCNLIHQFSKLSVKKYDESQVDKWIDDNYKAQIERTDKQLGYYYLIHTCLKEDNFELYDEKFNRSYKVIKAKFEKSIIKVDNDVIYIELFNERDEFTPEPFRTLTYQQLHHKYFDAKGYSYFHYTENKKGQKSKEICNILSPNSLWIKDENKRRCSKLVFKPCKLTDELNNKYFNMFQGFRAQHLLVCKDYSKIQRILFHLQNVICNKNEDTFKWFLKYLRAIISGRHTKIMIMIKGLEGCGKNIFLNMFAYGVIGSDYSIASSSPERQFFGHFNSFLINRVFAVINEGRHGMRDCIDTIKDLITEDKINIEEKFKSPITLGNYINFIGDTNNWNILEISPTDRRFVWLECNNEYVNNVEYFNLLGKECKNDESLSALYHYLLEEVSDEDIDFQKTRPITNIYKKLQRINLANPFKFLLHLYNKKFFDYKTYNKIEYFNYRCDSIYRDYKEYCLKCKYEAFSKDNFECKITEQFNNGIVKGTYQRYKIFKFYKVEFENFMKKFENLEDLPDFTNEGNEGDFLDSDSDIDNS